MATDRQILLKYAAFLGATGVAAGAFGAHALRETLSKKPNGLENWRTAVMYQLIHATALLALSSVDLGSGQGDFMKDKPIGSNSNAASSFFINSGKLMFAGVTMFSGSIYGLCLDIGPKKVLGPTTPLGGLLMIGGWVYIGLGSMKM
eukprot:CAMPEP_0194365794 /NCGR_PEP_ID=MMETSP0174-20130528/13805_1 /TAXON_ID=216777 /ORGANISM="Proboscia alata, Strain PI-D3" /LENGTH=146 /DNA_ID=CAMNT_0039140637 /DNA_START=39 /DNA_END=479 /DNA_ORIENTATION=+